MNKQIIKNIFFNVLNFGVNVVLGIVLTPFLIKHIGISAYGMVPLAIFITSYVGVLTQSLTASVNRYLINSLKDNDKQETNSIFNTALILMFIFILLSGFIFIWPIIYIDNLIYIPEKIIIESKVLFFCVLIGFFISLLSSIFSVSVYSINRIDLMQTANIIKNTVKLCLIFIFFNFQLYTLSSIGYSIIISELFALAFYIFLSKKLTPYIYINIKLFNTSIVRKLSNLSGWLIVDQIGVIFLSKTDLVVVNKIFGSDYGGKYSIIIQFSDLLRSMASLIGGVLGPVMMILYSRNEQVKMAEMTKIFMKSMSLTIAIPIVVICIFSNEIMELWVGPTYNDIAYLVWFIVFPLIINLGTMPLFSINIAMNKVKIPSILNFIFGVVGLSVSLSLVHIYNMGLEGIALGFMLAMTLKNSIFMPLYAAYILNLPKMTFLAIHIRVIMFSLVFSLLMFFIKNHIHAEGIELLATLIFLCFVGLPISLIFYTKKELHSIIKLAKGLLKKNNTREVDNEQNI